MDVFSLGDLSTHYFPTTREGIKISCVEERQRYMIEALNLLADRVKETSDRLTKLERTVSNLVLKEEE